MKPTSDHAPNPMEDWVGYMLWCELHACHYCDGTGEVSGDYDGEERECRECDGSGIDPFASETIEDDA